LLESRPAGRARESHCSSCGRHSVADLTFGGLTIRHVMYIFNASYRESQRFRLRDVHSSDAVRASPSAWMVNPMYFIRDYDGPKPFQPGSDPDLLILGQDPTVNRDRRFSVALGFEGGPDSLDSESRNLQRYIRDRILAPLGVDEKRIIATNLINAYYSDVPNKKIAKDYQALITATAQSKGVDIGEYPDKANGALLHAINFECGYRVEFEKVLSIRSIRHIITLGEPVFQVLRERYGLTGFAPKIRTILTQASNEPPRAVLAGRAVSLLPLPHIFNVNNRRWKFYDDFLRDGLPRLSPCYQP